MSEWQIDERGQRFRMVGGIKEYEMMVHIDGYDVPQSELGQYHALRKAAEEKRRQEEAKKIREQKPARLCPFVSGLGALCRENCGLYVNDSCALVTIVDGVEISMQGKKCPFSANAKCEHCALNNNGCAFAKLAILKQNS